ncbi:nuclear transport factor 2 family protein [Streptomyces gardneri]|nr:nuclear transport factor 2 family protein [Streptomyces gardneri]
MSPDIHDLAARESVRGTITRYAIAGDRGRLDELAACFTPEGTLEVHSAWTATGRDEIVTRLAANQRDRGTAEIPGFFIRHFVINIDFELVTDTEIRTAAYFQVLGPQGLDHWGRYRDVLVPHEGRWRFRHRLVRVDARATQSAAVKMPNRSPAPKHEVQQ